MEIAWMAILMADGENPRVKGILCNSKRQPLKFRDQSAALQFWMDNKELFDIDPKFISSRGTPQVVRDGSAGRVLYDMIRNEERIPVCPKLHSASEVDSLPYVVPEHYPVWIKINLTGPAEYVGVLCSEDREPLYFALQEDAQAFWDQYKAKFDFKDLWYSSVVPTVSTEFFPDDELIHQIDDKHLIPICPLLSDTSFCVYSDSEQGTRVLSDQ